MDKAVGTTLRDTLNFIDGEYRSSGKTFANINPATGEQYSVVHEASKEDVDAAVKAARKAVDGEWGKMPVPKRIEMVSAIAAEINRRFDDFLEAEIADTGKPHDLASHLDIPRGAANFQIFADVMKQHHGEAFPMPTPDGTGAINITSDRPRGVIAWRREN